MRALVAATSMLAMVSCGKGDHAEATCRTYGKSFHRVGDPEHEAFHCAFDGSTSTLSCDNSGASGPLIYSRTRTYASPAAFVAERVPGRTRALSAAYRRDAIGCSYQAIGQTDAKVTYAYDFAGRILSEQIAATHSGVAATYPPDCFKPGAPFTLNGTTSLTYEAYDSLDRPTKGTASFAIDGKEPLTCESVPFEATYSTDQGLLVQAVRVEEGSACSDYLNRFVFFSDDGDERAISSSPSFDGISYASGTLAEAAMNLMQLEVGETAQVCADD